MHRLYWAVPAVLLITGSALASGSDVAAIEEIVTRAYVEGVHNEADAEKIRSGFHSDFIMFVQADDGIQKVTREQWIERIEERGSSGAQGPVSAVEHQFSLVEITGDAAVARVEIHRDGDHIFTDYLSLYRFDEGWRIVGKIFYSHP
jgi:hypothetical protein